MDYIDTVHAFLTYAVEVRGYSPHTVKSYRGILLRYAEATNTKTISEITLEGIDTYLDDLRLKGKSPDYMFNVVTCIRAFGRYLNRRGASSVSFNSLEVPRRKSKKIDIIPLEKINDLIDNLTCGRDRIMALIMFGSGVRVNELVNIKVEDIRGQEFTVIGKGSKPRLCIMPPDVASLLQAYLIIENIRSGHIFRAQGGKPVHAPSVRYALKKAADKAGIEQRVYPHLLRHAFATAVLERGMDINTVAELMGHDQIQTTRRYLHVSDAHKKNQYDKFSPQVEVLYPQELPELHKRVY